VKFIHADATDLVDFADGSFDFTVILVLIHELTTENQNRVLIEALRVACKVIIVDSESPLSRNSSGLGIRFIEATFGHDHYHNFRNFLKNRGINGYSASRLPVSFS
jgi:ubiquinone/menaquinone biosynthesis C-methylase UbiE